MQAKEGTAVKFKKPNTMPSITITDLITTLTPEEVWAWENGEA